MDKDFKARLAKWREQLGYKEAKKRLKAESISESLAQKLLAETYYNDLTPLYRKAVESAMKKTA